MWNSADPDQMPHSVASDQGQHCLLRPICPNTYDIYGIFKSGDNLHEISGKSKYTYHQFVLYWFCAEHAKVLTN